jgi:hypothetical protein
MAEAAAGKSNIGIPAKVGREFIKADPGGKLPKKRGDIYDHKTSPKPK